MNADLGPGARVLLLRAIDLAGQARAAGNPPFGSLLADGDGAILAEAWNTTATDNDITAHPELKLARWAARELDPAQCRAVTMYTSCQPCAMCATVIARAGLGRVVFAMSTKQLSDLQPAGYQPPGSAPVELVGPAMAAEAAVAVHGFYR